MVLAGAVDGVSDEFVPPASASEDEEGWFVRRVVVEIKNRVSSIKVPPPFYDEIQLVTYCLMLGATDGDLVQCVRSVAHGCQIHIARVNLLAAPLRHADSWHLHIKPRLYAFARFVRAMRASTAMRFAWLLGSVHERRALVKAHLPFFITSGTSR